MKIPKYFSVIFLLAFWLSTNVCASKLTSSVDRNRLSADETLTLTISYDGDTDGQEPDIAQLQKEFTVLGRSTGSNIQIINGSFSRTNNWIYELQPNKTGKLLVPSFKIGDAFSDAITIDVDTKAGTKNPNANTKNQNAIYSEIDIEKTKHYVQEQILVTWRLVSQLQISDPAIAPPQIDGVMAQDLGIRQFERANAEGLRERVLEQRYALFPQRSGKITLPSQQIQFSLSRNMRSFGFGLLTQGRERKYIETESKEINVLPAIESPTASSSSQNSAQWLPARSITIDQEIIGANSDSSVTAGVSFTRVVRLRAENLLAEQLPPPLMDIQGAKIYSDNPKLENIPSEQGIIGTREDRTAIIAQQAGKLTLPAIHIEWYDIEAEQWRTAVLPAKTLTVLPDAAAATTASPNANESNPQNKAAATATTDKPSATAAIPPVYYALITALAAVIFAALVWVYKLRKKLQRLTTGTPPAEAIKPQESRTEQAKSSDEALTSAAASNDAQVFCRAVLQWANQMWPAAAPHSLKTLADSINDAILQKYITELEAQLYGTHQQTLSLAALAAQLIAWKTQRQLNAKRHKPRPDDTEQLRDLYE